MENSILLILFAGYILGLKKGTPINSILIEILKDCSEEEIIKESRYYSQIKSINYENTWEYFMKNLFLLYNLILSKADEQKIRKYPSTLA